MLLTGQEPVGRRQKAEVGMKILAVESWLISLGNKHRTRGTEQRDSKLYLLCLWGSPSA
jgi:hypothetical protein